MEIIWIHALYNLLFITAVILLIGIAANIVFQLVLAALSLLVGEDTAYWIRNHLTVVGTIHHELAHALFATLTGAKVLEIHFFGSRNGQLGSVVFRMRGPKVLQAVQQSMTAVAPVICGCTSLALLLWVEWNYCNLWWHYAFAVLVQINIALHMNMSSQDVRNALKGLPICLLLLYLGLCIGGYFGVVPLLFTL